MLSAQRAKYEGAGAVVLAAGKGTRMNSQMPKVLHSVCGTPMIDHVMEALRPLDVTQVYVVTGHLHEMGVRTGLPRTGTGGSNSLALRPSGLPLCAPVGPSRDRTLKRRSGAVPPVFRKEAGKDGGRAAMSTDGPRFSGTVETERRSGQSGKARVCRFDA